MNAMQEAEFHLSVYHYFLWRSSVEKVNEEHRASLKPAPVPPAALPSPMTNQGEQSNAAEAAVKTNAIQVAATAKPPPYTAASVSTNSASQEDAEAALRAKASSVAEEAPGTKTPLDAQASIVHTNADKTIVEVAAAAKDSPATAALALTKDSSLGESTAALKTKEATATPAAKSTSDATFPEKTDAINRKPASEKYGAIARAMMEQFPNHLSQFPPTNAMLSRQMPPIVTTLYLDYPALQAEVCANRTRIQQLEATAIQYRQQVADNENMRKALTDEAVACPPKKRARAAVSISSRTDIPNDIKKLIGVFQNNANKQKRKERKRITRLEQYIAKEKVATVAALAAAKGSSAPAKSPAKTSAAASESTSANYTDKPRHLCPPKVPVTFDERVKELEHFRAGNGHCRVPGKIPGLGRWVGDVRATKRSIPEGKTDAYLTPDRIALLDSMEFEWNVGKPFIPWDKRFEDMMAFKAETGHCNVPRSHKPDPSLGEWVHLQRKMYRAKSKVMEGERIERLEAAGFQWATGNVKPSFEQRLDECRDYRRRHGHLKVPVVAKYRKDDANLYESKEERSFIQWAHRQREDFRKFHKGMKTSLDKIRIRKLDELGFYWDRDPRQSPGENLSRIAINEKLFDEKVALLADIKEKFGDINDYQNLKAAGHDDKSSLYQWVKAQRKMWKAAKNNEWSSLTAQRIGKLDTVDFDFEPRKHYAPYGSKKDNSESRARQAAMQVVEEVTGKLDNRKGGDEGSGFV